MVLRSERGEREMAISEFLQDTFTTALEPDEILTEVRVPQPAGPSGGTYLKLERKVGDFATVAAALHLSLSDGTIERAGIGLTAVGSKNLQAADAEASLAGAEPTEAAFAEAGTSGRRGLLAGHGRPRIRGVQAPRGRRVRATGPRPGARDGPRGLRNGTRLERGTMQITVKVNGADRSADVEPRMLLAHLIREEFGLTGTHVGCDTTSCGACTVLLDGRPIKSCTMFGVQADGREVTTVEGLLQDGQLHPIQAAFKQEHGLQCGFCTPGMMLTGSALLAENPSPSEDEVRWAISGNICRCTGYMNIVKAIQAAGRDMAAGPAETADATVAS